MLQLLPGIASHHDRTSVNVNAKKRAVRRKYASVPEEALHLPQEKVSLANTFRRRALPQMPQGVTTNTFQETASMRSERGKAENEARQV